MLIVWDTVNTTDRIKDAYFSKTLPKDFIMGGKATEIKRISF